MKISENYFLNLVVCFATAFALTAVVKYFLKIFGKKMSKFSERTTNKWDDFLVKQLSELKSLFIFIWLLLGAIDAFQLQINQLNILRILAIVISCWQLGIIGLAAIKLWHETVVVARVKNDASSAAALELSYSALRGLFIVALILMALSNAGVDVGALLTGLGIGGIAVALAAQNILGDLLGSLSIALDKPFVVGDYIVVGDDEGTVEHIGIKTTRVRSISGEELIFSNKDLLESRLRNYKRMWRRRVSHKFSVPFEVPLEKAKEIPNWSQQIASQLEKLTFDRCHLSSYKDSFLNFEIVFWIEDTSYQVFMDLQQQLLLQLAEKMRHEGVHLSVPIRSIQVASSLVSQAPVLN